MTSLYIHNFTVNRELINIFEQWNIPYTIGDFNSSHADIDEDDDGFFDIFIYDKVAISDDAYGALAVLICEQMNVKILRAPDSDHSAQ